MQVYLKTMGGSAFFSASAGGRRAIPDSGPIKEHK